MALHSKVALASLSLLSILFGSLIEPGRGLDRDVRSEAQAFSVKVGGAVNDKLIDLHQFESDITSKLKPSKDEEIEVIDEDDKRPLETHLAPAQPVAESLVEIVKETRTKLPKKLHGNRQSHGHNNFIKPLGNGKAGHKPQSKIASLAKIPKQIHIVGTFKERTNLRTVKSHSPTARKLKKVSWSAPRITKPVVDVSSDKKHFVPSLLQGFTRHEANRVLKLDSVEKDLLLPAHKEKVNSSSPVALDTESLAVALSRVHLLALSDRPSVEKELPTLPQKTNSSWMSERKDSRKIVLGRPKSLNDSSPRVIAALSERPSETNELHFSSSLPQKPASSGISERKDSLKIVLGRPKSVTESLLRTTAFNTSQKVPVATNRISKGYEMEPVVFDNSAHNKLSEKGRLSFKDRGNDTEKGDYKVDSRILSGAVIAAGYKTLHSTGGVVTGNDHDFPVARANLGTGNMKTATNAKGNGILPVAAGMNQIKAMDTKNMFKSRNMTLPRLVNVGWLKMINSKHKVKGALKPPKDSVANKTAKANVTNVQANDSLSKTILSSSMRGEVVTEKVSDRRGKRKNNSLPLDHVRKTPDHLKKDILKTAHKETLNATEEPSISQRYNDLLNFFKSFVAQANNRSSKIQLENRTFTSDVMQNHSKTMRLPINSTLKPIDLSSSHPASVAVRHNTTRQSTSQSEGEHRKEQDRQRLQMSIFIGWNKANKRKKPTAVYDVMDNNDSSLSKSDLRVEHKHPYVNLTVMVSPGSFNRSNKVGFARGLTTMIRNISWNEFERLRNDIMMALDLKHSQENHHKQLDDQQTLHPHQQRTKEPKNNPEQQNYHHAIDSTKLLLHQNGTLQHQLQNLPDLRHDQGLDHQEKQPPWLHKHQQQQQLKIQQDEKKTVDKQRPSQQPQFGHEQRQRNKLENQIKQQQKDKHLIQQLQQGILKLIHRMKQNASFNTTKSVEDLLKYNGQVEHKHENEPEHAHEHENENEHAHKHENKPEHAHEHEDGPEHAHEHGDGPEHAHKHENEPENAHVHENEPEHAHEHENANEHAHEHENEPEHAHEHEDGPEHAHEHGDGPEHAHGHEKEPENAHEHENEPEHAHEHENANEHAHEHENESEHAHEHEDEPEHEHGNEHAHEHENEPEHAREHENEPEHAHEHENEPEHAHGHENENEYEHRSSTSSPTIWNSTRNRKPNTTVIDVYKETSLQPVAIQQEPLTRLSPTRKNASHLVEMTEVVNEVPEREKAIIKFSEWSSCSRSCGGDSMRKRVQFSCTSSTQKIRDCTVSGEHEELCARNPCPVDGGFTAWSHWAPCSRSCGFRGVTVRTRSCTNPVPSNGGQYCHGSGRDTRTCNRRHCPVNGGLSQWSQFGVCTKSCGGGVRIRHRHCNNPSPRYGGSDCPARHMLESQRCNTRRCPVKILKRPQIANVNPKSLCDFDPCEEAGCLHELKARCITDFQCNPVFFDSLGNTLPQCKGIEHLYSRIPETICGHNPCRSRKCWDIKDYCLVDLKCRPVYLGLEKGAIPPQCQGLSAHGTVRVDRVRTDQMLIKPSVVSLASDMNPSFTKLWFPVPPLQGKRPLYQTANTRPHYRPRQWQQQQVQPDVRIITVMDRSRTPNINKPSNFPLFSPSVRVYNAIVNAKPNTVQQPVQRGITEVVAMKPVDFGDDDDVDDFDDDDGGDDDPDEGFVHDDFDDEEGDI